MGSIRQAGASDVPWIERIVREAYGPYVRRIGKPPGPMSEDYADLVGRGLASVIVDKLGVCGFAVLVQDGDGALLDNVAVADRVRGRGVGRRLVTYVEGLARDAGHGSIRLYTHERMTENRALYAHLGYAETHRVAEKGFERVYFVKPL